MREGEEEREEWCRALWDGCRGGCALRQQASPGGRPPSKQANPRGERHRCCRCSYSPAVVTPPRGQSVFSSTPAARRSGDEEPGQLDLLLVPPRGDHKRGLQGAPTLGGERDEYVV